VGLELLNAFEKESILENVRNIGSMLKEVFEQELQDCDIFDGVLGRGLMLGIRLKSEESIGPKVGQMCLQNGIYIGYYGHMNNVLRIHPHLNIDEITARKGAFAIINTIKTFASDPSVVSGKTFASFFTE
jgi:4-aminobutyrate aminotransferase-like enzyme